MRHFPLPVLERPVQLQSLELRLIPGLHHLHRAPPLLGEAGLCTFVFVLGHGFGHYGERLDITRGSVGWRLFGAPEPAEETAGARYTSQESRVGGKSYEPRPHSRPDPAAIRV